MDQDSIVTALGALAHQYRLRIFRLLVREGPSGLPAGEIAEHIGISATSVSFHLKELENSGLVTSARNGRYVNYAVRVEGMRELLTYLTEDCCRGQPELCGTAFKAVRSICK